MLERDEYLLKSILESNYGDEQNCMHVCEELDSDYPLEDVVTVCLLQKLSRFRLYPL